MMTPSAAILRQDIAFDLGQVGARLGGGLDLALHKPADIAHGDSEIVLSLQVNPELRSVTEITAET